jgi:ATP-dependent exoDNAse (exonuclease V) beta subunit
VLRSVEEYEARSEGEEATLAGFLEDTVLGGRDDFGDDKEKNQIAVTLMTLHSAKGLEFPHVYMIGMEEGLMPHKRVIAEGNGVDEERRLCYVGVTRAEETLTLSMCKSRTKWGKARPSIPSRFLLEMRGDKEKALQIAEAAEAMVARDVQAAVDAEARKSGGDKAPRERKSAADKAPRERKSGAAPAKVGATAPARAAASPARPVMAAAAAASPARPVMAAAAGAPPVRRHGDPVRGAAPPARVAASVPVAEAGPRPATSPAATPSRPLTRRPDVSRPSATPREPVREGAQGPAGSAGAVHPVPAIPRS